MGDRSDLNAMVRSLFRGANWLICERMIEVASTGWKGSGASGKGTGGPYYILSYLREQSQTQVEPNKNEASEEERS